MKNTIIIYLIINCLFLGYIRLRDVGKLKKVQGVMKPIFIIYISIMALPLQIIYWLKLKIFPQKTEKIKYPKL